MVAAEIMHGLCVDCYYSFLQKHRLNLALMNLCIKVSSVVVQLSFR